MTYRLQDLTGNSFLDYQTILDTYNISKSTLHRLLTNNLNGVPHRNKVLYAEAEVTQLLENNGYTLKK